MSSLPSFAAHIKGDVVLPDDPSYPDAIARWSRTAERKAQMVVFVKDAEDVAAAIAYAKENKLPFAIRGGAHNTAGASSIEGGLVVDLSRYVNHVRIDEEAKLGYIGGGALWRDVDAEAIKYGLATVGGTVNHTGVGGLTLGGGYGWLTGRHGLTIDNLQKATIVAADGSILTASDNENRDLFWAIRGGGSNFGVVTEFVLRLHSQRRTVFAGPLVYTMDKVEEVVEATKTWFSNIGPDEGMAQVATIHGGNPVFVLNLVYNGAESEARERFKAFLDIEHIVDGAKEIPYELLNSMQNAALGHGRCFYVTGTAQRHPNPTVTANLLKKCAEVAAKGEFEPAIFHEYFSLGKVNAVASDATAFRRQVSANILVALIWDGDTGKTPVARKLAHEFKDMISKGQTDPNGDKIGYTNYDMDASASDAKVDPSLPNFDEKARQGFGSNYPKLQQIKKKYDPELFFNRWFPIAPAA